MPNKETSSLSKKSIDRLIKGIQNLELSKSNEVPEIIFSPITTNDTDAFSIRDEEGMYKVIKCKEIGFFESDAKDTKIHFLDGSYLTIKRKGIGYIASIVCKNSSFVRVHRRYIANLNIINWYDPDFKRIALQLKNNEKRIDVGKQYKCAFEACLFKKKTPLNFPYSNLDTENDMPATTLLNMAYLFYKTYIQITE